MPNGQPPPPSPEQENNRFVQPSGPSPFQEKPPVTAESVIQKMRECNVAQVLAKLRAMSPEELRFMDKFYSKTPNAS